MKPSRLLIAAIGAALVLPASAAAHPGVFTVTQLVYETTDTCVLPDATCLSNAQRTQYAVGNDGWANSFTEGNGAPAGRGILNYKLLPGTWRGTDRAAILAYAPGHTELQPHATCLGAAWDTSANILAWQSDPFFNYIPWQKTTSGLGDEPDKWIPLVKTLTGIDLSALNTEAEFTAACQTAGGTYYKADAPTSITTAQLTAATTPLQSQITTLQTSLSSLQAAKTAVEAQFAAAETARKALLARPLTLTLSGKRTPNVAMVTGAAGATVTVQLRAKKVKLASKKVTLDAQGARLVTLKPAKKVRKATKVTVEAVAGGVTKTASGVYVG